MKTSTKVWLVFMGVWLIIFILAHIDSSVGNTSVSSYGSVSDWESLNQVHTGYDWQNRVGTEKWHKQ